VFNVEIVMPPPPGQALRDWRAANPDYWRGRTSKRQPRRPCEKPGAERCPACGRRMSRNKDGAFRAHRPSADDPLGSPLCPGGNTNPRY